MFVYNNTTSVQLNKGNLTMKKPSKREQTLYALRVAGYHLDSEAFLTLRINNRVSYEVALENWYRGQDIKKAGIPCGCFQCKTTQQA
jgi:hypothetical protein